MTKRAQLLSQPFLVIFTLVVIALLILFGYRMIGDVLTFQKTIATKTFENDLSTTVRAVYNEPPGSNRIIALATPTGVTAVCFLNLANDLRMITYDNVRNDAYLYQDADPNRNVFFAVQEGTKTPEPLTIEKLSPATNVCIPASGALRARIENKGRSVDIAKP